LIFNQYFWFSFIFFDYYRKSEFTFWTHFLSLILPRLKSHRLLSQIYFDFGNINHPHFHSHLNSYQFSSKHLLSEHPYMLFSLSLSLSLHLNCYLQNQILWNILLLFEAESYLCSWFLKANQQISFLLSKSVMQPTNLQRIQKIKILNQSILLLIFFHACFLTIQFLFFLHCIQIFMQTLCLFSICLFLLF
jgi:hypothetical protein